jgi:hypothetical protein
LKIPLRSSDGLRHQREEDERRSLQPFYSDHCLHQPFCHYRTVSINVSTLAQAANNQIWREHIKKENALLHPNEEFRLTRGSSKITGAAALLCDALVHLLFSLHVSGEAEFG